MQVEILFLDAEFTGLEQEGELMSLAIVGKGGQHFYAEFTDFEENRLSGWHREHVLPFMFLQEGGRKEDLPESGTYYRGRRKGVLPVLKAWLGQWDAVVFWGDVPAYDWVLFCDLFGGALNLPGHIHFVVRDLATFFELEGYDVNIGRFDFVDSEVKGRAPFPLVQHNALADAWIGLQCLIKLQTLKLDSTDGYICKENGR